MNVKLFKECSYLLPNITKLNDERPIKCLKIDSLLSSDALRQNFLQNSKALLRFVCDWVFESTPIQMVQCFWRLLETVSAPALPRSSNQQFNTITGLMRWCFLLSILDPPPVPYLLQDTRTRATGYKSLYWSLQILQKYAFQP